MTQTAQSHVLMEILANNIDTDYGRRYGFDRIRTVGQFRKTLPVSSYDDYSPLITLMIRLGERSIFTSDGIVCYLLSFGQGGLTRFIPCTEKYMALYNEVNELELPGHTFFLNSAYPRLKRFNDGLCLNATSGALLAEYMKKNTGKGTRGNTFTCPDELIYGCGMFDHRYARLLFALSDENVSSIVSPYAELITDSFLFLEGYWEMLADDIEAGVICNHGNLPKEFWLPENIRDKLSGALKPNPKRASKLRAVFKAGFEQPVIHKIWPQLGLIVTQNFGDIEDNAELRRYIENIPIRDAPYFSAEALIGQSVADRRNEYALIPHAGFFEFAPIRSGVMDMENTLLMDELSVGGEYGIIVTNCLGFYRYNDNNVIRVLRIENGIPVVSIAQRSCATMCYSDICEKERLLRASVREFSVTNARFT